MRIGLIAMFTLNAASGLVMASIVLPVGAPVPRPTPAPRPDLPARAASIAGLKATECDPGQMDRQRTSNWQYAGVNYFDGWTYDGHGSTIGGVSVDLWNGAAWVDPASPGDYTYVWSMLTVPGGPAAPFVQVGWAQYPDGSRHTMVQYLAAGGRPQAAVIDPPEPLGTYSDYQVLLNYRPGVFSFFVGGRDVGSIYDVPATFTPTMAEIYGETHSLRSQMPGGSATAPPHQELIASRYWRNGWHSFAPGASIHATDVNGEDMSAYFGHSTPTAAGDLSIWDKAC